MKTTFYPFISTLVFALVLAVSQDATAQQLELYSGSASTSAMGPVTTANATLYQNIGVSTTYTAFTPAITVTVSLGNQQYTGSTYPGLTIGSNTTPGVTTTLQAANIFVLMNKLGSPLNGMFTSAPDAATAGTNFDITNNAAFYILTDAYYQLGNSLSARNYYGDVTVSFSRPVINPVLHFGGMGGGMTSAGGTLGFFTEFELSTADVTAGRTLTRLSGSTHFALDASNTKILDNSSSTSTTVTDFASAQLEGGAGSVIVNTGSNAVSSLTFRVYLRGNGGSASSAVWGVTSQGRQGDNFLLSASLGLYTISGTVYDDANGLTDNTVNGTGTNATNTLYANLVDNTNTVVASTAVASNGTYSFNVAMGSNNAYKVVLTTAAASATAALPSGYVNTGQQLNGGTASNATPGQISVTLNSANITNANFGIDQKPTANAVSSASQQNPGGNYQVTVPTLTGSDPEDQATSGSLSGKTVIITTLPANGTLYYNGVAVTAGQTITSYSPALLTVDPNNAISSVTFTYQYVDNAAQPSTIATVTMPFTTATPFGCASVAYQVAGTTAGDTLYSYNVNTGVKTSIAYLGVVNINAIGYNPLDNYIWGYDRTSSKVVRIDATGAMVTFSIPNLPIVGSGFTTGALSPDGYLYLNVQNNSKYYVVDVNTARATYLQLVNPATGYTLATSPFGTTMSTTVDMADWVYNSTTNKLIGIINPAGTNPYYIMSMVPATGAVTFSSSAVTGSTIQSETGSFGSVFYDASGMMYAYANTLGTYYQINTATNTAMLLSKSSPTNFNDGASCPTATLSLPITGTVYNDANGLADNTVNGTGTNAGTKLYAVLYDVTTGQVVDSAVVSSTGAYALNTISGDNYSIYLTTTAVTPLQTAIPTVTLPAGWVNTGENLGSGTGNDGAVNGILPLAVVSVATSNANFGIEQSPTAGSGANSAVNQNGAVQITVPASTFTSTTASSDPSPGAVTGIVITALPTGATSITINSTNYTSATFPAAGVTVPTDGSGNPTQTISVDPTASGATSVSIPFKAVDAAGVTSSNTGTAVLTLTAITISGNIYDDANGLTDNTVNKNGTTLNNATVNAVLVNANTNLVAATASVTMASGAGTYSFAGADGGTYYVMLTTNTATVGSAPPAIALPAGWVSTGENLGAAAGSDGTADSKLTLGTINTNTANANFGIDKTPTANAVTGSTQANPGGTGTVTVPTITGSDPEDGTYNGTSGTNTIIIQTLPANGTLYYNGVAVMAGQTISNYTPALLTLDPNDGVASVTFTVSEVDAAGQPGTAATVTMPFTSSITGNVYYDANGLNDNTVNGTGTNAGGLNAVLYDNTTGKVAAVSAVSAGGVYSLNNTPGDNFSIYITTLSPAVGSSGAPAVVLPIGYGNTGENLGSGTGSDGTPDGILSIGTLGANLANANFGIQTGYYDFGDVPVGYELNNSSTPVAARNAASNTLYLGTMPDQETGAASVVSGADNNGSNGDGLDEDGVSSPPAALTVNTAYSLAVSVTNTTGAARTLWGWIDFNNNGIFESTEMASTSVANNASTATLSWTAAQAANVTASKLYMRLRIAGPTALADNAGTTVDERAIADGASTGVYGTAQIGEVEDYQVSVNPVYDFGDAPVGYESNSSSVSVPARNTPSAALLLGTIPDAELTPASVASGADNNGTNGDGSDEDGIASPPLAIVAGTAYSISVTVTNTSGSARTLYGWIDFNNNGIFESTELASVSVATGTTSGSATLTWTAAQTGAGSAGKRYMRLRIANGGLTDNAGTTVDERAIADGVTGGTYGTPLTGEVEDYQVSVANVDIAIHKTGPLTAATSSTATYTLQVSNYSLANATNVTVSDPAVSGFSATSITCTAGSGVAASAACPASPTIAALQNGTLTIPSLPAASNVTFTITGTITGSIGSVISNTTTASTASGVADADLTNNSSAVKTTVIDATCAGASTTYTLDKDATLAAASTVGYNGGTVNLIYNLTSGTAVPGIGSSFTVPLSYSDLNANNGTNHQWFSYATGALANEYGGYGAFVLSPNAQDQTAGSGSIYNGLPANNQQVENIPGGSSFINYLDASLTTLLANGSIDLNGTFTTTIGNYPTAPSGYIVSSKSFQLQGRNNSNNSGTTAYSAAWYVKPIDQPVVYTPGTASHQAPVAVEYGNTYKWKYADFANGTLAQNASRGAEFYGTVTYKNTSGCQADISVVKTGTTTVSSSGAVSYTIVVSNAGTLAADGTAVSDPAVSNFTATGISCGSATGGAVCPTTPTILALQAGTLTIPTLPSGGSVTFTITGTAGTTGSIANTATVTTNGVTDYNLTNNSSTANTSITDTVSGTVYNDVNGLSDNTVNGVGSNAGGTIYAILYDNTTGKVAAVVAVASNGTYSLPATAGDNVSVYISAISPTVGSTAIPTVALPTGWANTGAQLGTGTASNTTPGILNVGAVIAPTANANFGIEQNPSAGGGANSAANQYGTGQVTVPASTFTNTTASSDPLPGAVTGILLTTFPTGATSIVINGTGYTSATWPAAGVSVPTDGSGNPTQTITVDPTASGATTVTIPFKAVDAAGVTSTSTGNAVLTLVTVSISGTVYNDANGLTDNTVNGTGSNGGGLNAVLIDAASGNVVAVAVVAANGTYSFPNQNGGNYQIEITTNTATVGNTAPAVALPAGYVNTGSQLGGGTATNTTPGILNLGSVTATSTTNANLGIEQTPTAGSGSNTATNTGVGNQVTVPANTFTNTTASSDPSPGTVSAIKITSFPANARSIVINGTSYTSATWPVAGVTVPADASGNPTQTITVSPTTSGAVNVTISFLAVDNAGQQSSNTGTAVLGLTSPCGTNAVANGSLATDLTSWTNSTGGWAVNSTNGYAYDITNGTGANQPLSQTVSNIAVQSGKITLTFNYAQSPCTGCTTAQQKGNFYVQFGGTQYLTLSVPAGGTTVTATAQNGATVSPASFATRTGTQPLTTITLTIPTAAVSGTSGLLSFIHGISGGEWNDNLLSTVVLTPACADLSVNKTGPATTNANGSVSYSLLVANNGGSDASGATVSDPVVSNFTATTVTCSGATGGAVCPASPTVAALQAGTLSIPTLPNGSSLTFTVTGTAGTGGSIVNVATVSTPANVTDAIAANNTSTANTVIQNSISGNVYNDANGLTDNTVNGTLYAGSTTLYAVLYDNTLGQVVSAVAVSGGTYSLSGKSGDNFTVYLTTTAATVGQSALPAVTLPTGYVSTGEHLGAGTGSDGTPNSILPVGVVAVNTGNANFGMVQCPNGLSISVSSNKSVICASAPSSITLSSTTSGGITAYTSYSWSGSGIGNTNTQSTTATPTATTTYSVTVTDAVGCTATSTTTVTYDQATPSIALTCGASSGGVNYVRLNENSGLAASWLWTTNGGGRFYADNTLSPDNDGTAATTQATYVTFRGTYTVAITDANGCNGSGFTIIDSNTCGSSGVLATDNLNFTAVKQNNTALLNWSTASETNNRYFNIERSSDGADWQIIGTVNGAGNSSVLTRYSFVDRMPLAGKNYYRLKQVDANGQFGYSPVRELEFAGQWLVKMYPNPVQNYLVLEFNNDRDENANIEIQSVLGNTVFATQQQLVKGLNRITLSQVQQLANGTYIVLIGTTENMFRSKFVKGGN